MRRIISHIFIRNEVPEGWTFHGFGKSSYIFRADGLLINGVLTIPFYGRAWDKFKVALEVIPVASKVSLDCGDESRAINMGLKSPDCMFHKIYRTAGGCSLAEIGAKAVPNHKNHLVVFEFDNGKIRGLLDGREVIAVTDPAPKPIFGRVWLNFSGETLVKRLDIFADDALNVPPLPSRRNGEFDLEVAVDFPDDLCHAAYDQDMFDRLFREFKSWGVKRVEWLHYPPDWYVYIPASRMASNYRRTMKAVGDVLKAAVDAAHAHNVELYGVFKPFDVGLQYSFGDGTPEAVQYGKVSRIGGPVAHIMDFAAKHPEYLMARKPGNYGQAKSKVVNRIDLVKETDTPADISIDDIEIWVSNNNVAYQLYQGTLVKRETIEDYPVWEHTSSGDRQTAEKKRCVVFRFDKMMIDEKYIALSCRKVANSFGNTLVNLIHVFGEQGEEHLVTYGAVPRAKGAYSRERAGFQDGGIEFDKYPDSPTGARPCRDGMVRRFVIDSAQGLLAIAMGKDRGELAALSPSFAAVRNFWLEMVREMLTAGVDGVDLRFSNHQWTFAWDEFGFESPVVDEFMRR